MRLEKIVVHGFKSFAEKTEIQVLPGITGVVGPNGCGKCLSGETPVALADGRLVPIREIVETALVRAGAVQSLDDGVVAFDAAGLEVLSLNPETLKLERRPVDAFIRRAAPPFLLRVRTRSGREVVTTHYHPFFTLEQGALKTLTAETLHEGIRIALPRCLPVKPWLKETLTDAILTCFGPEDRVYLPPSQALQEWLNAARRRAGGWQRLADLAGVGPTQLENARDGQAVRVSVVARIASIVSPLTFPVDALKSAGSGTIRVPEEVDGRLARFLGYLIAEGQVTKVNQVWFVNSDPLVTAEFSRLARDLFEVVPRELVYKATATDTLIFSRALCLLLDRVFGIKVGGVSADKVVPPQVLAGSDEVVREFLSGLFEGDAYVRVEGMPHVEYMTASRQLADGVVTLLLRLGIFALMRPKVRYAANTRARRRRTYYGVYIYGVEQLRRLAEQLRFAGRKQSRLDDILQLQSSSNPNLDLVPGVTSLVRAATAAGALPIKPVRPLSAKLAAYSERRCEASRAGLREIAGLVERHGATPEKAGSLIRQLRALAESDVYWDAVVSIEKVAPPEPWVYDLTVAETHNFVAGNIIVHNSNIAEAIRWALGEQSPKSLRGHKMEDVVFYGSASRKPLGMAEVSLTFANDGALSVPWSEIQVSRRLYRTGESEYLLNKSLCRLRDVLDLFVGTGVNPKAYALMEQERLNQILTAKPLDRRVFIEEAAGISRYKQQRAETLGKLEGTRQNLLRVRDVMDEVKRQLVSLERQARKAQQYKALQQERRGLALTLLAAEYAGLAAQDQERKTELARLREREERVRADLSQLSARQATQRAGIQETEHHLADLRQSVQKIQGELERLLERREQVGLQMRDLGEEDLRLQEEMRLIGERRQAIAGERGEKELALQAAVLSQEVCGERVRSLEDALAELRASLQADRERLESLRLEQVRAAGERAELTRRAGELREREAQIRRRRERLGHERAEAVGEAERLESQARQIEAQRAQALSEIRGLEERRARLEAELAHLEAGRGEAQSDLAESRLSLASLQSSLEALERLEREREGYGAGVRAVFAPEASGFLRGVVGTVADLLDVPAGLELAVEAALGDRLSWVVVERFEDGKAALAYLDQRGSGVATFLPLETLPTTNGLPPEDEEVRWAARLVGSRYETLLRYLLGRVAVVPHLSQAENLWRRNGVSATYVTPSGEALSPTGRLTGGRSGESGSEHHSLLRRKGAIRQLSEEVARLRARVEAGQSALSLLEIELAQQRSEQSVLQRATQNQETARLSSEKDLEQAVREQERLDRYREALDAEERQLATEAEEARLGGEELERALGATSQAEARIEATIVELRGSVEISRERESRLGADLTSAQVEWASLGERVEALRREAVRLEEADRDLADRFAQDGERRGVLAARQRDLSLERERADLRAREVAVERDRLEGEEARVGSHHRDLVLHLEEIETSMKERDRELEGVVKESHAVELRALEAQVRCQELEQEGRRSFGVEPPDLAALHDAERELPPVRSRLAEVEGKIEAMGPVNLVADEEYRELEERLGFLRTQHDDLTASMKDLERALRGMTRTAQERFLQAFEAINGHFGQIFSRLFEGGRAELRIVEAEEGGDPLESGVELLAEPRGKRLGSVTLLSGGEKALTGLALLFAIFYYRPSPFCVLDEVDAPLDDANIDRFLRVLQELGQETQFIVITHNRKTMEAADVLYGVTMEEPGLSSLVSVKLAD